MTLHSNFVSAMVVNEVNFVEKFDIAIIGAGPGGYIAAIHAAKVARRSL